jgi:hypothetical protein
MREITPAPPGTHEEFVRLWFGPSHSPRAVLRATEGGESFIESLRAGLAAPLSAEVVSEPGRWAMKVSLPSTCLESDGVLLLGAERHDARGERTAAPRAMLPWQEEPGRVAIDTAGW